MMNAKKRKWNKEEIINWNSSWACIYVSFIMDVDPPGGFFFYFGSDFFGWPLDPASVLALWHFFWLRSLFSIVLFSVFLILFRMQLLGSICGLKHLFGYIGWFIVTISDYDHVLRPFMKPSYSTSWCTMIL